MFGGDEVNPFTCVNCRAKGCRRSEDVQVLRARLYCSVQFQA